MVKRPEWGAGLLAWWGRAGAALGWDGMGWIAGDGLLSLGARRGRKRTRFDAWMGREGFALDGGSQPKTFWNNRLFHG
jgi:hypothetical protein